MPTPVTAPWTYSRKQEVGKLTPTGTANLRNASLSTETDPAFFLLTISSIRSIVALISSMFSDHRFLPSFRPSSLLGSRTGWFANPRSYSQKRLTSSSVFKRTYYSFGLVIDGWKLELD